MLAEPVPRLEYSVHRLLENWLRRMAERAKMLVLMVLATLICSLAAAQKVTKTSQTEQAEADYKSMLARIKDGDLTVDFRAFRLDAALAGRARSKVEFGEHFAREGFMASGNYQAVLQAAQTTLERNYASVYAHFEAMIACRKLGNIEQVRFHEKLLNLLAKSILESGSGKSMETAWIVVNVPEEYFLLRQVLHLSPKSQYLVNKNGHIYDRIEAVDPRTNQTLTLWFNTDVDMPIATGTENRSQQ